MWKRLEEIPPRRLALLIAIITLLGILILFLPIVIFGISRVVQQGETRDTEQEVFRSEKILLNEITRLDQYLLDWSSWDETYQFAQDTNQAYIEGNLSDSSITNLDIDLFLTLNPDNQVVYGKYIDRVTGLEAPIPVDIPALLAAYPALLDHSDLHAGQKGIVYGANLPMLIASRPILTSAKTGPPAGTLIWIRLLDAKELAEFSQLAERTLSVFPAGNAPAGTPALPQPGLLQNQSFVHPTSTETILGFKYLEDLNGQPLLVLQVANPRTLYRQGRSTALIFSGILLYIGLLLFSISYHVTSALLKSRRSEQKYLRRFQTIVHQSSEAILLVSAECKILEANPVSRELLAWQAEPTQPVCLKTLMRFEPDLDETRVREISQRGEVSEHRCVRYDGAVMEIELSASLINDPEIQAYSLILRDVTARKQAEKALKASEERYMLAVNGANDGLWDWNVNNGTIYYSPRWKAMLGYADHEVKSTPEEWFDRVHPEDILGLRTQLSDHLRNRTANFECEHRILHKDGTYRWVQARGVAARDQAGLANRIAGSLTDITGRKQLEEQLRYDALHDHLTGLGNRTLLLDHLGHANERKKRRPELLFALFFLDFDRFKQINDTLGHQAGDQLLMEAAHRLELGLRATDTITRFTGPETLARIAGDEFVLLLEDFHSTEDIQTVAERVTSYVNAPYCIAGQEVTLTASIGLVIPEAPYEQPEDIIRDADIAMYRAKQLGGSQMVQFHPDMYQETAVRMQIESDLRKAVEQHEFEVYYQPIFTLDNDDIAGFEALVRWNHPEKGLLLPADFLKVAEEVGLIVPIGYYVLESACQQMQTWQAKQKIRADWMISINVSARQLTAADLMTNVRATIAKTGFNPRQLWFEVTESTLLENTEAVLARLNELRSLGIHIVIDDFGTGYSSLSYLQNLPVDGFKIDRSFIKDIQDGDQQIIKTLLELGHNLGLTEVAEGVETERQKAFLKSLSCQYAQGFLMSRPVSASAMELLLVSARPDPVR